MKNNRLLLVLLISGLLVLTTVVALALHRLKEASFDQIRMQGASLTRSLSMLPVEGDSPFSRHASVLHSLQVFQNHSDFAYGAITALDGSILTEVRGATAVPLAPLPPPSSSLFGERYIDIPDSGEKLLEFYGPVMKDGEVFAYVRLGYFAPGYLSFTRDLPFLALLALVTFMLVPLVYLMIKREMRTLDHVHEKLEILIKGSPPDRQDAPLSAGIPAFAETLTSYVGQCESKIAELEAEKTNLLTSNRLLQYSSRKMNFLLHSLPDGLLVLDPAGHITFASEKVRPLLGVDNQTVLNNPLDAWCADDALKALLVRLQSSGLQPMRTESVEIHPVKFPEKSVRITACPLISVTEDAAFGTMIVLHDTTQEQHGKQVGHDFVAQVSHELKSPLNTMRMYCEMLQTNLDDRTFLIEASNVIGDEVERMTGLVNNLLNISKMENEGLQLNRSRIRTEDLLQDIYQNLLPRAEEQNVTMELEIQKEISALLVDKEMMRIAINNLLTNALKYNRPGGAVHLRAQEEAGEVIISVQDTGIGIAEEDQPEVFRKYFRANKNEGQKTNGHGLGLYLASEIIQLHHGRIQLESVPGQGSTFSIHLKKSSVVDQELNIL